MRGLQIYNLYQLRKPGFAPVRLLGLMAIIIGTGLVFTSCNGCSASSEEQSGKTELQEGFHSSNVNGKWTIDRNTAMELRAMQSSIENFSLLIKKQPQNLDAYKVYGDLLQNHVNRTVTYCSLDNNAKTLLCKDLDKIKAQIELMQREDIAQARQANLRINALFTEIESTFNLTF